MINDTSFSIKSPAQHFYTHKKTEKQKVTHCENGAYRREIVLLDCIILYTITWFPRYFGPENRFL